MPKVNAREWLAHFGYLNEATSPEDEIVDAIKRMQVAYGLIPSGELTAKTEKAMLLPRCGLPDVFPIRESIGGAGSTLYKWNNSIDIKVYLDHSTLAIMDLPKQDIIDITRDYLNSWQATSHISYILIDNPNSADVRIGAGTGSRNQFDGPGNVLAWAELVVNGKGPLDMMLDGDEPWVGKKQARGIKYYNTGNHEFGHINGLTHSRLSSALMAPTYSDAVSNPQEKDDIPRMKARYPGEPITPTDPSPSPDPDPGGGGGNIPGPTPRIAEIKVKYAGSEIWNAYKVI